MWELSDRDFKIAVIKCINDVVGKVDNIHCINDVVGKVDNIHDEYQQKHKLGLLANQTKLKKDSAN